jgi:hypothetical protein
MADINVQRKSPSALWWILGILAVGILLWFLFAWESDPAVTMRMPSAPTADIGVELTAA